MAQRFGRSPRLNAGASQLAPEAVDEEIGQAEVPQQVAALDLAAQSQVVAAGKGGTQKPTRCSRPGVTVNPQPHIDVGLYAREPFKLRQSRVAEQPQTVD